MSRMVLAPLVALLPPLFFPLSLPAQDLAPEAKAILDTAQSDIAAIQRQADAAIATRKARLEAQLRDLERQLRLQGKGDAAARIAETIRQLGGQPGVIAPPAANLGKAEVEWNGTWYPASVLKTEGERYFIHYDGYGSHWDEWVGRDRIRFHAGGKAEQNQPDQNDGQPRYEIESRGAWYPGKILKVDEKGKRYYVLYHTKGIDWEEWVPAERIRPQPPK